MQDLDRSAWVQIFVILILFMILDGCGDYQRSQRQRLIMQQEFTRSLDSSGTRIVFRDQYDQTLGKWRLRKHKTRVYDAALTPQGYIIERDDAVKALLEGHASSGDVLYEAHRLDGATLTLSVLSTAPDRALYALGEAFEIERQHERWTLFHKEPYRRPVARLTFSSDPSSTIQVRELQTEFGTVERIISQGEEDQAALIKSSDDEAQPPTPWRGPRGVSSAMMTPFVLKHVQWSSLEQSMFALLLDATRQELSQASPDPSLDRSPPKQDEPAR